ncbi:uncharacterized protein ACRADG_005267 [Cochliomyia hominivorax]
MLLKVILLISTINILGLSATSISYKANCVFPLTCHPTTPPTPPTKAPPPSTRPTPPLVPPSPPVATPTPPTCNNCPKPDCSMVPDGTRFPYANHCKLFYWCSGGSAVISACPNGQWFERETSQCMLCELVLNCEANKD